MGVGSQRHPQRSPPRGREGPVRIVQEVGWAPGPVWTCAENLAPLTRFDPLTWFTPVAGRPRLTQVLEVWILKTPDRRWCKRFSAKDRFLLCPRSVEDRFFRVVVFIFVEWE